MIAVAILMIMAIWCFQVSTGLASAIPPPLLDRVHLAMEITREAATNITQATKACDLWRDILETNRSDGLGSKEALDPSIRSICLVLQASCLVRIGDDQAALLVYDEALETCEEASKRNQLLLGKARSLQRLLRYKEAVTVFRQVLSKEGVLGAATCALRLGHLSESREILEKYLLKPTVGNDFAQYSSSKAAAMLDVFNWRTREMSDNNDSSQRLRYVNVSPINRWLTARSLHSSGLPALAELQPFSFFDYCSVNIGPFDDPLLVHLDDKILLHRLLTSSPRVRERTRCFWPPGTVVGSSSDRLVGPIENDQIPCGEDSLYFLKERAGYGSHGNTIVADKAKALTRATDLARYGGNAEQPLEILVQEMVEPPLLLQGRKFSLRIYIVLFAREDKRGCSVHDAYISDQGLVKLAALALNSTGVDTGPRREESLRRSHMTNSGREAVAEQHTLDFLQSEFQSISVDDDSPAWNAFWSDIVNSARTVIDSFNCHVPSNTDNMPETEMMGQMLVELGLPKILGLDFVVDASRKPWLVEINRFPGLEPRDTHQDAVVKTRIVCDAWRLARDRVYNQDAHSLLFDWMEQDFERFSGEPKTSSLKMISDLQTRQS